MALCRRPLLSGLWAGANRRPVLWLSSAQGAIATGVGLAHTPLSVTDLRIEGVALGTPSQEVLPLLRSASYLPLPESSHGGLLAFRLTTSKTNQHDVILYKNRVQELQGQSFAICGQPVQNHWANVTELRRHLARTGLALEPCPARSLENDEVCGRFSVFDPLGKRTRIVYALINQVNGRVFRWSLSLVS